MPRFDPFADVPCKYGAPMGRPSDAPGNFVDAPRLYARKARFVDGCYDKGGAYWGAPANVWAVWTRDGESVCYVRAGNHAEALRKARCD